MPVGTLPKAMRLIGKQIEGFLSSRKQDGGENSQQICCSSVL